MSPQIAPVESSSLKSQSNPKIEYVRLSKINSQNTNFTKKLEYLFKVLENPVKLIKKDTPASKVDALWGEVRDSLEAYKFFNLDQMFDTFMVYEDYFSRINRTLSIPISLALLFQRFAGPGKSFEESARLTRATLQSKLDFPIGLCNQIYNIICSGRDLDYNPRNESYSLFTHLNLARLALPWPEFSESQDLIRSDAIHHTGKEFLKIQKAIFFKLGRRSKIYELPFFNEYFETSARINITRYVKVIQEKLNEIFWIEEEERELRNKNKATPKTNLKSNPKNFASETVEEWMKNLQAKAPERCKDIVLRQVARPFVIQNNPIIEDDTCVREPIQPGALEITSFHEQVIKETLENEHYCS